MDSNTQQQIPSQDPDSLVDQTLEAKEGTSEVGRIEVNECVTIEAEGHRIASSSPAEPQVDYLSSLPPELLTPIFDLSHNPESPPREPLSRTLLPYFRRNFYRQIRLLPFSSLTKLVRTVETSPSLGSMVLRLDASRLSGTIPNSRNLEKLLPLLPSLESLKFCQVDVFSVPLAVSFSYHLQCLHSISLFANDISWSDLDSITHLAHLKSFELDFKSLLDEAGCISTKSQVTVERLTLTRIWQQGTYAPEIWTAEMARYVNRFPRIAHLTLLDEVFPDYSNFLAHLDTATISLKTLTLDSPGLDQSYHITCDHLLPRFVNLERLDLGDGTVSESLPSYLRQLPRLSYLRLGADTHYDGPTPEQLLPLIEGPTRLQNLKALVLDPLQSGAVGRRVDANDSVLEAMSLERDGWDQTDCDVAGWDEGSIASLEEAGFDNDVEVTGSSVDAAEVWAWYSLEKANRIILEAYQSKSFDKYTQAKEDNLSYRLPDLDVDRLDPQNLKLVKIDLPEEEWFQFTLE